MSKTIVVYPGRFQPFGPHHLATYANLTTIYGVDSVFITTSDKHGDDDSPLSFINKRAVMIALGVPPEKIVLCKSPYQPVELLEGNFDMETDVLKVVVGEKDMRENPRFNTFVKKDGSPAYFQPDAIYSNYKPYGTHGYLVVAPTVMSNNTSAASSSKIREVLRSSIMNSDTIYKIYYMYSPELHGALLTIGIPKK